MSERPTQALRRLLQGPEILLAPGAVDGVNARLVAEQGFKAVYMTGAGTTATRLGMPDVGLLTMTEMVDNAQRVAEASGLPVIADADTGYGGVVNVRRTVRAYERAGVAAIHLEDQGWPKRCGHLSGKTIVPVEEMVAKIRAAVDARDDPDFHIIARTDAVAVEGYDAAIERARRYEEAGADVIFMEALSKMEQIREVPRIFRVPTLYNMSASGKTPFLSAAEMQELGYRVCIYPNVLILAAIPAVRRALATLKETGAVAGLMNEIATFREFFDLLGMEEVQKLEAKYTVSENARVGY
jgi:2,3-dimethylmalate lyase